MAAQTNGAVADATPAKRVRGDDPELAVYLAQALTHDELAKRLRAIADGSRRYGAGREAYLVEAALRLEKAREEQLVQHAREMQALGEELG